MLQTQDWKSDIYPICKELLVVVKMLDSFNISEQRNLLGLLQQVVAQESGINVTLRENDASFTPKVERYMQGLLKLHQTTALVDIDFSSNREKSESHISDILAKLQAKGGLEYCPREQSVSGRSFEHACDARTLIRALSKTQFHDLPKVKLTYLFKIRLESQVGKVEKDEDIQLRLNSDYLDVTLKSNGKMELYFHAYFWTTYISQFFPSQDLPDEIKSHPSLIYMTKFAQKPKQVLEMVKKYKFGEEDYLRFIEEFGGRKVGKNVRLIEELQRALFVAQIQEDTTQLDWIEKILIQLLGYHDINIRDEAVIFLNMLYDGIDWQLTNAFVPVVRCVGQHFKVNLTVQLEKGGEDFKNQIFLGLSAPSPLKDVNSQVLTWHKIMPRNILQSSENEIEVNINFGKFWKCGFYDWRLILLSNDGRANALNLTKPPQLHSFPFQRQSNLPQGDCDDGEPESLQAQGRFVVHSKGMRDQSFHEVQIDYQNAELDFNNQTFRKRGSFLDVENALTSYKESGITALYLMGVFERDNMQIKTGDLLFKTVQNSIQYKKSDASALAVTSRITLCEMLGGAAAFQGLVRKAKEEKVKIIVDCLARISSSRHHRKYKELLLHYLDEDGRRRICYGTDGQQIEFEDTAMLNYRKKAAWDLLIEEVLSFAEATGVDGIHLDNGQAWPQIFEPDLEELSRLDVDGQAAYSSEDFMNGEIVKRNENHGYWNTNSLETYANPFFIKMCRQIWNVLPNFIIMSECWGGHMFENRQIILARSGVIPRLYKLPQAIASLFGKKLYKDGRVENCEKASVTVLRKWYEQSRYCLPQGSIMLQSSSATCWPYPAYLYGKGTWAAVDILFFLPDVPITFMGELDGEIYRIKQSSVFQTEKYEVLQEKGVKRVNSRLLLTLAVPDSEEEKQPVNSLGVRVRSGHNLNALLMESKDIKDLNKKEDEFAKKVGQDKGYDLKKIRSHYDHRRQLRSQKLVLRYGDLMPLLAKNNSSEQQGPNSFINNVLAFARFSLMETAVISVNLSDDSQKFYVDMSKLVSIFNKNLGPNTVVMVSNLLDNPSEHDYFFLREFLTIKHWQTLMPYSSSLFLITICQEDKFIFQKALRRSIERTKEKLLNGLSIEAEQISQLLTDVLKQRPNDTTYFANLIGSLQENFLDKINMNVNDLFLRNYILRNDPILTGNLMALCEKIMAAQEEYVNKPQQMLKIQAPVSIAKQIFETNILGPIVFCTPEVGTWSTVGGLGVMVDELSLQLASLGQNVIVISPYYDRIGTKKMPGWLSLDPHGFKYIDNIKVVADKEYEIGVHEGTVGNVLQVFLHHSEIFPSPYVDTTPAAVIRQLSVFGKACLEYCCKRQLIPSICVTNDWFTGFVAAYAKLAFGLTFKGTTFLHICHNLQEAYEGRIFPDHRDGAVEKIHQLPRDLLVDQSWQKFCLNPSRCALMMSDQWATVSKSYRDDLLSSSPLAPILKLKDKPFAFPNGVPIKQRLKKLDDVAPNHAAAKQKVQQKYFNFSALDDDIPLFCFVGRVTQQKGVHLILEVAEEVIKKYNYRVQFLVAGPANRNEPYSRECADKMTHLNFLYPNCFWAKPDEFFYDGALVNRGADFGLMPSLFEPGGIVQHEFFVGGTPVIAHSTGGLKDSVIEFQWDSETGSGFSFLSHHKNDLLFAIDRAIGTFLNKPKYLKLRQNAFNATMSGEVVTKAWLQEFYRLRNKVYFDYETKEILKSKLAAFSSANYQQINIFEQMFGHEAKEKYELDDLDFGAEETKESVGPTKVIESEFDRIQRERLPHTFNYPNRGPRFNVVQLCGSFDNWEKRHSMSYDHFTNQWFVMLHLPRGEYIFKYVINTSDWRINEEEEQKKDSLGNLNNYIKIAK